MDPNPLHINSFSRPPPTLKIRDDTNRVIAKHDKKRSHSTSTITSFASAALSPSSSPNDDDETVTIPPYYYNSQRVRVPTSQIAQMPEEKRAKLYATNSPEEFMTRRGQLQQAVAALEEQLLTLKKQQVTMHVEMRNMLQKYLDLEREITEVYCRIEGAQQSQEELERFKPKHNN